MAFPTTSVLTSFTGADENPLSDGGNWSAGIFASGSDNGLFRRVSNAIMDDSAADGTGSAAQAWVVATYGPPSEVFCTLVNPWQNANSYFWLWLNGNAEDTVNVDGYRMHAGYNTGVWYYTVYRVDNGVSTELTPSFEAGPTFANGDSIGARCVNGRLNFFYKTAAGSWGLAAGVSTRVDTTYTTGHIGVCKGFNDTTTTIDDFGGGTMTGLRVAGIVESLRTGTSDPMTWSHNVGTTAPKGVLVGIMHGTSATDHVSSVTYGGVAMTEMQRNTDTATEPGAAEWWWLGTGIPTGTQTVSADLASGTTDDIHGVSITLDYEYQLNVLDVDGLSNTNSANPSRTMNVDGRNALSFAAFYSGLTAHTSLTAGTGCVKITTSELAGNFTSAVFQQIDTSATDFAIAVTSAADDVAYACIAIGEFPDFPDTCAISLTESISIVDLSSGVTTISTSDSSRIGLTEAISISAVVNASDSCSVRLTEARPTANSQLSATESTKIGTSEAWAEIDLKLLANSTIAAPALGVYPGQYSWTPGGNDIPTYETASGIKTAHLSTLSGNWANGAMSYVSGHPRFDSTIADAAWAQGRVIQAQSYNIYAGTDDEHPTGFTVDLLLAGTYDSNLSTFASDLRAFSKPVWFQNGREPQGIGQDYMGGWGPNGDQSTSWAITNSRGYSEFVPPAPPSGAPSNLYEGCSGATIPDGVGRLKAAQRYLYDFFVRREALHFLTFDTMGFAVRYHKDGTDNQDVYDSADYAGHEAYALTLFQRCSDPAVWFPGEHYCHWVSLTWYFLDYYDASWSWLSGSDILLPNADWIASLDYMMTALSAVTSKPVILVELGFPDGMNSNTTYGASKVTDGMNAILDDYPQIHAYLMWADLLPADGGWFQADDFPYNCLIAASGLQSTALKSVISAHPGYFHSYASFTNGDTLTSQTTPATSDTLSVRLSDAATVAVTVSTVESLKAGLSDAAAVRVSFTSTDTIAVRLTEASATIATTLSTLDGLAARLTEVTSASVTTSPSDSSRAGLTEALVILSSWSYTDSVAIAVQESATVSATVSFSETVSVHLGEAVVVANQFAIADALTIGLTDQATITDLTGGPTLITSSDSVSVRCEESSTVAASLSALENVATIFQEAKSIGAVSSTVDSVGVRATETSKVSASLLSQETIAVSLAELSVLSNTLVISDALAIRAAEASTVSVVFVTSETVSVSLNPDLATIQDMTGAASITSVDTVHLGVTELVTIQSVVSTQDVATLLLNDAKVTISSVLATSDTLLCGFGEAAEILGLIRTSDTIVSGSSDTATLAIPVTAIDTIAVGAYEGNLLQATVLNATHKKIHIRVPGLSRESLVRPGMSKIVERMRW